MWLFVYGCGAHECACVLFTGGWALDRSHAVPLSGHTSIQDVSARLYLFGGTFIFRVAFQLISPPAPQKNHRFAAENDGHKLYVRNPDVLEVNASCVVKSQDIFTRFVV